MSFTPRQTNIIKSHDLGCSLPSVLDDSETNQVQIKRRLKVESILSPIISPTRLAIDSRLQKIWLSSPVVCKMVIEQDRDDDVASVTTTTLAGACTPSSEWDPRGLSDHSILRDADPQAGDTFIIIDQAHGRAIAVIEGELRLEANACQAGNRHWLCVEKDGWLGFRNTGSGRYLGHNIWWNFVAEGTQHRGWEFFHARRHDGGYLLLVPYFFKLFQIAIGEDDNSLAARDNGGTVWEFIKVE